MLFFLQINEDICFEGAQSKFCHSFDTDAIEATHVSEELELTIGKLVGHIFILAKGTPSNHFQAAETLGGFVSPIQKSVVFKLSAFPKFCLQKCLRYCKSGGIINCIPQIGNIANLQNSKLFQSVWLRNDGNVAFSD